MLKVKTQTKQTFTLYFWSQAYSEVSR